MSINGRDINLEELHVLVSKARDLGIESTAFEEIYKMCGFDYYSTLYVLNEIK